MARLDIVRPTKNAMQLKHSLAVNGAMDAGSQYATALLLELESWRTGNWNGTRLGKTRLHVLIKRPDIALKTKNATQPRNSLMVNGAMDAEFSASVLILPLENQRMATTK